MANPIVVDIPHKLGRAEVKRRLRTRIGELGGHIPGGVADVRSSWPSDDRMAIEVSALGQTISGTIDADENVVHLSVLLPPALSFMSGAIEAALRRKASDLLLEDRTG